MSAEERCLVLMVEDDPSIAEFVESALSDEGYQVVVTSSGEEGLQQVAKERPAIILLDMLLPGMSGGDFMRRLQDEFPPHIPIILMTAAREEPAQQGIQTEGLLLKPFELSTLLDEVERVTAEHCRGVREM